MALPSTRHFPVVFWLCTNTDFTLGAFPLSLISCRIQDRIVPINISNLIFVFVNKNENLQNIRWYYVRRLISILRKKHKPDIAMLTVLLIVEKTNQRAGEKRQT